MKNKKIEITQEILSSASKIYLLLMVKEKMFSELYQLRQESTIEEPINEILHELCEDDLIRLTGIKESPFEMTGKGDAAADMFILKNEALHSLLPMIENFFDDWLENLRIKRPDKEE